MIISLNEATRIDSTLSQEDLDAFEIAIRELTNNNFQNRNVRFENVSVKTNDIIVVVRPPIGLRVGDTIELNYSDYNDGLYVIESIEGSELKLEDADLITSPVSGSMITKVEYPADIKAGVKRLIKYDIKMGDKVGIKAETISRMSTTYYDMSSTESVDGYPAPLLNFTDKYKKMRW